MDIYKILSVLKGLDEAANPAQQSAIAVNMKKHGDKLQSEGTMDSAEQHSTGPEFTGYWKGTDKRTPGKHMVGGSMEESIEDEIGHAWNTYLAEFGANNGTTTPMVTGGTTPAPTAPVDPAAKAKQLANTQTNLNKLKSAGIQIPAGVTAATTSAVKMTDNPGSIPNAQDKAIGQSLGADMAALAATSDPAKMSQLATTIKQMKQAGTQ